MLPRLLLVSATVFVPLAAAATAASAADACPTPAAIPAIDALAAQFPGNWLTAEILPEDAVAKALYETIVGNATYKSALAIQPQQGQGGEFRFHWV